MTFWWKKYTKIRKRKVPLDEPNADFVKFAEEVSLKLHDQFTQNPTKNHKQMKTFRNFPHESSAGQKKTICEKIVLKFGRISTFLHFSQSVPLDTQKALFRNMAKGFRSEAKCNPLNSKKLQIENQKKWNFQPRKKKRKNTKRITARVDCSSRLPSEIVFQIPKVFRSKSIP